MEISFSGQYDQALFHKAVILANQPPRSRRIMNSLMVVFVLAAGVVLLQRILETGNILDHATYIALVMIVAAFVTRPFVQPRLAARSLWKNPSVQQKLKGTINNHAITYVLENGQNRIPWENINRLRKTPELVTLVTITGLMLTKGRAEDTIRSCYARRRLHPCRAHACSPGALQQNKTSPSPCNKSPLGSAFLPCM